MRYENLFLLAFLAFMVGCQLFSDESGDPSITLNTEKRVENRDTEIPTMDSRVVSYQTANWSGGLGFRGIIAEPDVLNSWFPDNLNNEECNYFVVFESTNSTSSGHLVLAEDMVLYHLRPSAGEPCMETDDIFYDAMLVCDDAAGTFRNNINLNGSYAVPGWDCNKWETVPEKGYF